MNICEISKVARPYQTFHQGKNGAEVFMFTKDGSLVTIENDEGLVFPEKIDKKFLSIDDFEFVEWAKTMTFKTEYEKFKHDRLNEDLDSCMDVAKREKVDIPFWQKAYSVIDPLSVNVVPEEKKKIIALLFFGFAAFDGVPSVIETKFLVGYYGWDDFVGDYVFTSEEGSMFAFKGGKTPKTIVRMFWNYLDELRVKG